MLSKKLLVLGKKHMFGVRAVGGIKKEKKKKKPSETPLAGTRSMTGPWDLFF